MKESPNYVRMASSGFEQGREHQENDENVQKEALVVEVLNALEAIEDSQQQIEVGAWYIYSMEI